MGAVALSEGAVVDHKVETGHAQILLVEMLTLQEEILVTSAVNPDRKILDQVEIVEEAGMVEIEDIEDVEEVVTEEAMEERWVAGMTIEMTSATGLTSLKFLSCLLLYKTSECLELSYKFILFDLFCSFPEM